MWIWTRFHNPSVDIRASVRSSCIGFSVRLHEILGRAPTDQELAEEMKIPPAKIVRLRTAAMRPAALEAPEKEGEPNQLANTLRDECAMTPYEQLEKKTVAEMIKKITALLNPREFEIIRHRFGLDGEPPKTLDAIGPLFGLTRERIRQIQNNVLCKLRKEVEKIEMDRVAA